ncbi:hypothetical protein EYC80_006169 [Monilinia laxa]|uniref:Uncharacterized protein n=1 Tax=Monilinia laxa TaxID=61186 RepID=A0A5N6KGC5_MONLA|nr:hypothetical protein EYC80_006169 [Monilinia laxa]
MDEGLFAFEEDDDYQTSNDEYGDETENQQWERCNMMQANQDEPASSDIPADQFLNSTYPVDPPSRSSSAPTTAPSNKALTYPKTFYAPTPPSSIAPSTAPSRKPPPKKCTSQKPPSPHSNS